MVTLVLVQSQWVCSDKNATGHCGDCAGKLLNAFKNVKLLKKLNHRDERKLAKNGSVANCLAIATTESWERIGNGTRIDINGDN